MDKIACAQDYVEAYVNNHNLIELGITTAESTDGTFVALTPAGARELADRLVAAANDVEDSAAEGE